MRLRSFEMTYPPYLQKILDFLDSMYMSHNFYDEFYVIHVEVLSGWHPIWTPMKYIKNPRWRTMEDNH